MGFPLEPTARHKIATLANRIPVDDVIIAGSVSDEDAKRLFAQGWEAPKLYLHGVKQPI
jgi:hypothetical protein